VSHLCAGSLLAAVALRSSSIKSISLLLACFKEGNLAVRLNVNFHGCVYSQP